MFVTFFDTCMVTLCSLIVWRFSPYLVVLPWLFFATVDGLYLSSALTKVPDGAWFTITISGILACIFLLWRFGKESQWLAEAEDRFRPSELIARSRSGGGGDDNGNNDDAKMRLTARWGGDDLSRIRGMGIYFDKTGINTPAVFTQFVSKIGAVPDAMVFFHLHPVETPSVADGDRYAISRLGAIPSCYRLVVRHGFMDEVITPDLAALIYEQVRAFVMRQATESDSSPAVVVEDTSTQEKDGSTQINGTATAGSSTRAADTDSTDTPLRPASRLETENGQDKGKSNNAEQPRRRGEVPAELRDESVRRELAKLDRAYASKVMYLVGKEQMRIRRGTPVLRAVALAGFLWIRDNTRAKIANLRLAMDRVIEVGFVKDI